MEAEPTASEASPGAPPEPPPAAERVPVEPAHGSRPASAPPRRSALPWALITLFVILTAVAVYFWMSNGEDAPDPTARTETPAAVDPSPALTPAPTDTTDATAAAPEAPADDEPASVEPDDELPRIVPADGGFTWIVASRRDRALAEQAAARFRDRLGGQLVPVGVVAGTSGGQSRYRVGVGQVPDADAANALRQRLGDVLPADAWLLRLQPDM
ncbi:MAG: SPOR domain-containing protein [Rhodothermales bacterium]|nr:SPOR domain-containing protein [Rhodothermales bacterium]